MGQRAVGRLDRSSFLFFVFSPSLLGSNAHTPDSSWASSSIVYSSRAQNMCIWAIACSSSVENMCGSCSSYSSFRAKWASSCSSYSSSRANMCGWAIGYSSPFRNMCRWATFCSSSRENMCGSCSSRSSPVSYRRKELARATVSWSARGVKCSQWVVFSGTVAPRPVRR